MPMNPQMGASAMAGGMPQMAQGGQPPMTAAAGGNTTLTPLEQTLLLAFLADHPYGALPWGVLTLAAKRAARGELVSTETRDAIVEGLVEWAKTEGRDDE